MADERQLSAQTSEALSALEDLFPGAAQPAEYVGLVIDANQLVDVATFLRDEMGYAYLSCVTGLDYPRPTNGFPARYEVAYNLYRSQGGALTLHVHADRDEPVVPTLVGVWPSANVQEREAWDLMGIRFEGHPDPRRILLWEGFDGHPLRKDWHEPYYEEDQKPFRSRFPKGDPTWVEEHTEFERNLQYPKDWVKDGVLQVPQGWKSEAEDAVYLPLEQVAAASEGELRTDQVVLNIGPQHPSTHGVLRMVACLDGETICGLQPVLGYLHRSHEKIGERNLWLGNMPFTDRLDYITSMYNNFGYAVAVEKLLDVEVPERAEYIRVIMGELTRLMNHLVSVGFLCNDLGIYFTAMLYALEEREFVIDLFEMASGSRMMCNYYRFGGVAKDLPDEFVPMARELVFERFPRRIDEMETFLLDNEVFRARTEGIGVLPPDAAVAYGCTGPLLRGSGVPYDVRRAEPYSAYDEFDWDVVVRNNGDVFDRVLVRFGEMRESLRILRQALDRLPDGPIQGGRVRPNTRVPEGEAYGRVEHPKGELGFYLVSDGGANPYRYHIRTASFVNLGVLGELCRGNKIADVVAILGSIDITLGEVDR
jgi:NADH:ubiquinone oxidoreductase subunit D/NADH:ubiquinone oxidoreductase subunit C